MKPMHPFWRSAKFMPPVHLRYGTNHGQISNEQIIYLRLRVFAAVLGLCKL
jgi:hypothetical protein